MAYCNGDKSLVTGDPSYGSPAQTAQRIKAPVKFIAVNPKTLALDLEGMIQRLARRRARVPVQPEQPDVDRANVGGHRADGAHHQAALAGDRHPDRRGLSRVRDEAGRVHDGEAGARAARRVRLAHVLQGLRHGRHAHGLRDWPARHGEKSRQCVGPRQHQRAPGGGRHRGAERQGAHGVGEGREQARARLDAGAVPRDGLRDAGVGHQLHLREHPSSRGGVPRRAAARWAWRSAATSRRWRRATRASRSAAWKTWKRRCRSSSRCSARPPSKSC